MKKSSFNFLVFAAFLPLVLALNYILFFQANKFLLDCSFSFGVVLEVAFVVAMKILQVHMTYESWTWAESTSLNLRVSNNISCQKCVTSLSCITKLQRFFLCPSPSLAGLVEQRSSSLQLNVVEIIHITLVHHAWPSFICVVQQLLLKWV